MVLDTGSDIASVRATRPTFPKNRTPALDGLVLGLGQSDVSGWSDRSALAVAVMRSIS